jgi:hypothetical protein
MACHGTGDDPAGAKFPAVALFKKSPPGKPATGRFIGTYWPYATTLFDYTRRAMPANLPGSLTNDEVYAVAAYILSESQLLAPSTVLDATTLPKVKMPAQPRFIPDDRKAGPEVK